MAVLQFTIPRKPIKFVEYCNVRAKVMIDANSHKPTFMLEATNYDTLWRMYVAYVLTHPSWAGDDDAMRMIIYMSECATKVEDSLSDHDSEWKLNVTPSIISDKLQISLKKVNWIWKEMERKNIIISYYRYTVMPGYVRWPLRIHQATGWYTMRFYGIRINYHVLPEDVFSVN